MNIDGVVQQLKQQRSKLDAAIQALEGVGGRGKRRGEALTSRTDGAEFPRRLGNMEHASGTTEVLAKHSRFISEQSANRYSCPPTLTAGE